MRNFIKIVLFFFFSLSPFLSFSQEQEMKTQIDSWRYWYEMAALGIIPFDTDIEVPPAIFQGTEINSFAGTAISPDIITTTGTAFNAQSENSVFVDPTNNQVVVNSNNTQNFDPLNPTTALTYGVSALFSFDGGDSWIGGNGSVGGLVSLSDPAVAINGSGNKFINYIDGSSDQSIAISVNGTSWTQNLIHSIPGDYTIDNILDKNHLWVDNSNLSANNGNLYSAWTIFQADGTNPNDGHIQFSRSLNNGFSWSSPIYLSTNLADVLHMGVNIQTDKNGDIYVIWSTYSSWPDVENGIAFCKSTDGGQTFSPAIKIQTNLRGIRGQNPQPNPNNLLNAPGIYVPHAKRMRTNSFPCMAADISGTTDNIYIVFSNHGEPGINTGSDISIYFIVSSDGGSNWSNPTRVNQDPIGNIQYFPWVSCDPITGDLSVIFYDDRNVGATELETWVAVSTDEGASWYDFRVSDVSFTPMPVDGLAGTYMGDYIGIASRGGLVYPVWTDNRSGAAQSYCSPFILGCQYDISITATVPPNTIDEQEALNTITANNLVSQVATAVYHAGTEVLLEDGFTSHLGSQFRAYNDVCNSNFVKSATYDPSEPLEKPNKPNVNEFFEEKNSNLSLNIYPNPTTGIFSVEFRAESSAEKFEIKIFNITKGLLSTHLFTSSASIKNFQIDISKFSPGVYFVEIVNLENNKIHSGKIVKL